MIEFFQRVEVSVKWEVRVYSKCGRGKAREPASALRYRFLCSDHCTGDTCTAVGTICLAVTGRCPAFRALPLDPAAWPQAGRRRSSENLRPGLAGRRHRVAARSPPPCVRQVAARIGSEPWGRWKTNVARYGQAYKDRIVARLLPPESSAVERVSREVGVSVATLERWRADALANGAVGAGSQRWTAAARLEAVIATAAMDEATRSAWCREQGLYPAELEAWKRDAIAGLGEPRAASAEEARQDRRRVKELERELHRKDKALAETAALLVLSKKLSAVFHDGEDA